MTFVILRTANTVAGWYREGGQWKPQWIVEQITEQLVRKLKSRRLNRCFNIEALASCGSFALSNARSLYFNLDRYIDSTEIPIYGHQKQNAYNGHLYYLPAIAHRCCSI